MTFSSSVQVEPTGPFLWLNLFKLASAMFGIYGFMILSKFSRAHLNEFTYWVRHGGKGGREEERKGGSKGWREVGR